MSQAKGDQGQAVKHPRDAHAIVAGGETEALSVPVSREPGIKHPGAATMTAVLQAGPPRIHGGREEDVGHSQHQQPKQEIGEQHAGRDGGCALPEQAQAGYQRNEGAEIGNTSRAGTLLGTGCHTAAEIAFDQAQDSKADYGRSKSA